MTSALAPLLREALPRFLGSKYKMLPTPRLLFPVSVRDYLVARPQFPVFWKLYVTFRTMDVWFQLRASGGCVGLCESRRRRS
jgi:hypothetical protein